MVGYILPLLNQIGFVGFGVAVTGVIWLFVVLYGIGWLWPLPDCKGRLSLNLWILFLCAGLI